MESYSGRSVSPPCLPAVARSATFKGNADGSDCSRAAFATTSSDTPAKTAKAAADFRLYSGGEDARRERERIWGGWVEAVYMALRADKFAYFRRTGVKAYLIYPRVLTRFIR